MARRKKHAEWHHEDLGRWLLTYADMITLLMLFFIIMYAMSNVNAEQYKQLSQALQSVFSGGNFSLFLEEATTGTPGIMEGVQSGKPIQTKKQGSVPGTGGSSMLRSQATSSLQNFIKSGRVKVIPTENGLAISLISDFQFAAASATLTQEAFPLLQQVAGFLTQIPNNIVVEGHTDNAPVDTTRWSSNWQLSGERALSVLQGLTAYGVPDQRLAMAAYGDTRPVQSNDTPEGRAYNRRVDIIIVEKQ
jgi:chemotaxis protein MotB